MKSRDHRIAELFVARRELAARHEIAARSATFWPSSGEAQMAEIEIEKIEAAIEKLTGSRPQPLRRSAEKSPAASSWDATIERQNARLAGQP